MSNRKMFTANINVFLTKDGKVRARITEYKKPPYEVTIGGTQWKRGIGNKYRDRIINKAAILSRKLIDQLNKLNFEEQK